MKENFYTKDLIHHPRYLIGDFTYGTPKILDWDEGSSLKIGKFCSIAEDVKIFLGGNHRTDWNTTYPFPALTDDWPEAKEIKGHPATKGDVIIGNDVWIGFGAVILSGIKIGDGAVIGANSVVSREVGPYTIVAGNPAKILCKRLSDENIARLLDLKWWDWPVDKIRGKVRDLCSDDSENLLKT